MRRGRRMVMVRLVPLVLAADRHGGGRERHLAELGHRCPQKDMMYQQVLTDGVRIVLELDGRRYQHHAGGGRGPFYCATPERPAGE
ncbi:MAG: hypothetical protein ACR2HP_07755 [Ilumatobacteraceae bacterium]